MGQLGSKLQAVKVGGLKKSLPQRQLTASSTYSSPGQYDHLQTLRVVLELAKISVL